MADEQGPLRPSSSRSRHSIAHSSERRRPVVTRVTSTKRWLCPLLGSGSGVRAGHPRHDRPSSLGAVRDRGRTTSSSTDGSGPCSSAMGERRTSPQSGPIPARPRPRAAAGYATPGSLEPTDPVFCGLQTDARLQETILADIIRRATARAGIEKHVTAHTLSSHRGNLAAAGARRYPSELAEYLGHADLRTVARYAHVDREELHDAARKAGAARHSRGTASARIATPERQTGDPPARVPQDRPHRRRRRRRGAAAKPA